MIHITMRTQILIFLQMMSNAFSEATTSLTTLSSLLNLVSSRFSPNLTCLSSGLISGTFKAVLIQKKSSTDASIWEALLLLFGEPT